MIKSLAHVCILSSNLAKTKAFYIDLLGLSKTFDFFREKEWVGFYIKAGQNQFIEVFLRGEQPPYKKPAVGITHFCLEVESIQTVHAHLKDHGIETTQPLYGVDHSWQIWCKDPDGIDIEFHEYTDKSCQLTGSECQINW